MAGWAEGMAILARVMLVKGRDGDVCDCWWVGRWVSLSQGSAYCMRWQGKDVQ